MKYFTFLIYTLLFITVTIPISIVIFDFFDIKFQVYGNYLLWFIALALFNALLPYQTRNVLEGESSFQSYTNIVASAKAAVKKLSNTLSPSTSENETIDIQGNVEQPSVNKTPKVEKKPGSILSLRELMKKPLEPWQIKEAEIKKSKEVIDGFNTKELEKKYRKFGFPADWNNPKGLASLRSREELAYIKYLDGDPNVLDPFNKRRGIFYQNFSPIPVAPIDYDAGTWNKFRNTSNIKNPLARAAVQLVKAPIALVDRLTNRTLTGRHNTSGQPIPLNKPKKQGTYVDEFAKDVGNSLAVGLS